MLEPASRQLPNQYPPGWNEEVRTGRSEVTFRAISRALQSLSVGVAGGHEDAYLTARKVNGEVFPKGPNIPIAVIDDVRGAPHTSRSAL
jgi:hypothetical protein